MKIAALIIVLILLAYFLWPRSSYSENSTIKNLSKYFDLLQNSAPSYETLIISINSSNEFIQFSRNQDTVEIDFPLITDEQKSLEQKYRTVLETNNLEVRESIGIDDSRFLDADLPKSTEQRTKITEKILVEVFGVTDNEKLKFTFQ